MRLTLDEYSKHFKMSKEMIHSKLRSKKLNYIIENGITYIIVTRSSLDSELRNEIHNDQKDSRIKEKAVTNTIVPRKQKTTVAMVLGLYQKENQQLKDKILQLETKIDKLIDDKEQMLRDEMAKIEHVYSSKDEQLKNILELINAKLVAESTQTIHEIEPIDTDENTTTTKDEPIIELKHYLKTLDLESYQRKVIKKRFLAVYSKDVRVIKQNGKIYLDFSKYDYSDLLEY
ncbi:hypothetical protein JHD47_01625 [Sulfurimonas sp. SAG-AH-194-L11]|nr:hypothetical protein [Sulfurimonas sp. SAG-AH-194-L11]MDF1876515.1 hypothetical protein [Sulfurimonas sp. SAG-AH-194-L11]